jgi:hypothetical protein
MITKENWYHKNSAKFYLLDPDLHFFADPDQDSDFYADPDPKHWL